MLTEWDEDKRQWTLINRGLDFADFPQIMEGTHREVLDERNAYGEDRWIVTGHMDVRKDTDLKKRLVIAVYTLRGNVYRVLSMRKGNPREEKAFKKLPG